MSHWRAATVRGTCRAEAAGSAGDPTGLRLSALKANQASLREVNRRKMQARRSLFDSVHAKHRQAFLCQQAECSNVLVCSHMFELASLGSIALLLM